MLKFVEKYFLQKYRHAHYPSENRNVKTDEHKMEIELPQAPSLSLPLENTGVREFVLALPSKAQQDSCLDSNL